MLGWKPGINSTQSLWVSSIPRRMSVTLGYVLPTLTVLKKKLFGQTTSRHVRPLQPSLLEVLDKRFGSHFTDKSFLIAAVLHPKFKIAWCDDPPIRTQCTQLLENAILNTDNDITLDMPDATSSPVHLHSDTATTQCSDDFFDFTNADASSQKHLLYLNDSDRDVRMLEVRKLFNKYNTAIASSAPVESLFSSGALVLSKRRNALKLCCC